MNYTWTENWPTEPGWYWFYGFRFSFECNWPNAMERIAKPELHVVQVIKGNNCTVYVCSGAFLYKDEGARGVWQRVLEPELPKE
jgi:hypothetical protein